jgi:YidC/Oxa1 family membrane protein insertase
VLNAVAHVLARLLLAGHSLGEELLGPGSGGAWIAAVVGVTLVVRLALSPLYLAQVRSGQRMRALAPELAALRRQHGADRARLTAETQALYRERGVNPALGCLPVLVQLPVTIGLYRVLSELRPGSVPRYGFTDGLLASAHAARIAGAPITAAFTSPGQVLAQLAADPARVRLVAALLCVALGLCALATAAYSQRVQALGSVAVDPVRGAGPAADAQRTARLLLTRVWPPAYAALALTVPLGLVLYWLLSSAMSLAQQAYVVHLMRPAVPLGGTVSTVPESA